jgi:hypothetical protein
MLRNCYVYTFANSLNGLVFYVGKGSGPRIRSHFWDALSRKEKVSRVALRIREIWQQGGKIIIRQPYKGVSNVEAFNLETELIEQYGYTHLVNDPWAKHRKLLSQTLVRGDSTTQGLD